MEQEELTLSLKSYLYQLSKHLVQDEMEKYFDKLNELQKRIEALELESYELKARVEKLEQAQKRGVTQVIVRI